MRFFVSFILLFLSSCEKFSYEIQNLNNNEIQVLGHGGMGIHSLLPMNSLASVSCCIDNGAQGTEIDVQLSKDGYLVAYHDKDLSDNTTGSGVIRNQNWSDFNDSRYKDLSITRNYPIRLVSEIMESIGLSENVAFSLDCKLYSSELDTVNYYDAFTDAIITLINLHEFDFYIESDDLDFLNLLQSKKPEYKLLYLPSTFSEGYDIIQSNSYFGLSIATNKVTQQEVQLAHDNGYWISLWNVHTKNRNREAILKSPDCIQADKLNHLFNLLD